jgi:hypothetical protein
LSEEKVTFVKSVDTQPLVVKLKRGSKGQYSWEIEFKGDNADGILYTLDYLDSALKERYLGPQDVFSKTEAIIENVKKSKPLLGGE